MSGWRTTYVRLYNLNGKLQSKRVTKYLINWEKKSKSKLQFKVKQFFKGYWQNHIVYEEFPVYGSRMAVDFLNATKKIAIEVNGPQHSQFHKFFHSNSRVKYLESIKRDYKKRKWLESNNFTLLEIEESDVEKLSLNFIAKTFDCVII